MLTEIALTPDLFFPERNSDISAWESGLRQLGHQLEPLKGIRPLVISDLFDGAWYHELPTPDVIRRIPNQAVREKLQQILTRLRDLRVSRPGRSDWPTCERDWAKEALVSSLDHKISRVFVSATCEANDCGEALALLQNDNQKFWDTIGIEWDAPMDASEQAETLRPLCIHARWISFVSPHALTNEVKFLRELLRVIVERPKGWPGVAIIDIHTDANNAAIDRIKYFLQREIPSQLRQHIRVYRWEGKDCRERLLMAGDDERPRARWGVSMPHVAFQGNTKVDSPPAPWTLASSDRVRAWFRRFYDLNSGTCLCLAPPMLCGDAVR